MSATGKNLAAIDAALKQHDADCGAPVREIQMNHYEVERLGWDDFKGIPIVGTKFVGTGRFRLICDGPAHEQETSEEETVEEREGVAA